MDKGVERKKRRGKASVDFRLKSRDWEILSGLEKWGVLGLGQIEGLFFGRGVNIEERVKLFFNEAGRQVYRRYPYKRMFRFERAGLIRAQRFMNFSQFYSLSEAGYGTLTRHGRARFGGFMRSISGDFLRHEMSVNGVGMILQEFFGLRITTERERVEVRRLVTLPHQNRLILSDLWVVDGVRPVAIEVERTKKSEAEYRSIWDAYKERMLDRFPEGKVLYLTMDVPSLKKRLMEYARKWEMDFIYFAELEDFRSSMGRCRFVGFDAADVFVFEPARESPMSLSLSERKGV